MLRIVPVLEAPSRPHTFWMDLPDDPWPAFIELVADASPGTVALAVLVLCSYGHGGVEPLTPQALVAEFTEIAPGGLAISSGDVWMSPSCCCGLERWRSWHKLLRASAESPWLGHDPAPWVECIGDGFMVWADGGLGGFDPETTARVALSRAELAGGLDFVEKSLRSFSFLLEKALEPQLGARSTAVGDHFRAAFIDREEEQ